MLRFLWGLEIVRCVVHTRTSFSDDDQDEQNDVRLKYLFER